MKFLWQQIISFFVLIFVTLGIISYRVENAMTEQVTRTLELQLLNYGNNITSNNFSRNDLVKTTQLLASENIVIQVYLSDGRTIYPNYDQRFDAALSKPDLKKIQNGEYIGFRKVNRMQADGKISPFLIVYLPHKDVGEFPSGFISLAAPLDALQSQIQSIRKNIVVSFVLTSLVGIFISFFSAIYQTRKIKKLQVLTKEITSGNYDLEVDTSGEDEFGDLSRDFQRMSDSLLRSEQEIARQEQLRRQFMMDVAHEMRTPLTTMSGMVEGLKYDMIPVNQRQRSLELIQKETQRLIRLVNEQLDYEKIISRQIPLNKVMIEGDKLFSAIKEQMDVKATENGISIRLDMCEGLEFWADYDRLMQIIINLVTNAIQFSQDSEVVLRGRMEDNYSQVEVIDQGIGIAPKNLSSIWERFYKVDESRKNTKFGESGIGLSVVKSLVEAHDGEITVKSKVGKGSTFTVRLPHQTKAQEPQK